LIRDDGSYGDNDDAGSPLASVADWADTAKYTHDYHWTGPLHYIDIRDDLIPGGCPVIPPPPPPPQTPRSRSLDTNTNVTTTFSSSSSSSCHFDYQRDCPRDFCVAGAIVNYTSQLAHHNKSQSMNNQVRSSLRGNVQQDHPKRVSLEFVTHFVGDIHQPLHSSRKSDIGGNAIHVHFRTGIMTEWNRLNRKHHKAWNLHSVWDDGIIDKALSLLYNNTRELFEADLMNLIKAAGDSGDLNTWLSCGNGLLKECTTLWGEESLQDALSWAYRDVDGGEVVDQATLTDDYYKTRLPIVKRRLAAGGVRLAATLEHALGPNLQQHSATKPVE